MDIQQLEAKLTAWEFQRSFESKMAVIKEVKTLLQVTQRGSNFDNFSLWARLAELWKISRATKIYLKFSRYYIIRFLRS